MDNLLTIYNLKFSKHALDIFVKSNALFKERKMKQGEDPDNIYYTYELNEVVDYAIWIKKYGVLYLLISKISYTPFALLTEIKFHGSVSDALNYIDLMINKDKIPFIRVGSEYFKVLGDKELIQFNKAEIRQDYGGDVFSFLRKYDKFGVFPNNINYKESVGKKLNTYHRPKWESYKGDDFIGLEDERVKWSIRMMKHIFGGMFELGMEYMQMLWCNPEQMLPILVLGSTERQTGKTTFSNWTNDILGDNHVSLGLEDMKGDFNHFFAEKLLITIEETQDESYKLVNKLKRISTARELLVNPKGVKQYVVNFYGKILILTNSPDSFLKIDNEEIRFWVLPIPTLNGMANHNIEEDLRQEIPYFIRLLESMEVKEKRSRMWFHPEEIITESLKVAQAESLNSTEKELLYLFNNEFRDFGHKEVYFNASDIKNAYFKSNNLVTRNYIAKILGRFASEGIIKESSKKISYISSVSGFSQRIGNCFWVDYNDVDMDEPTIEADDDDNIPF